MHGAIGMSSAPLVADARRAISRLVGIHDFKPPATPEVSDSRKSAGYGDCRRSSSHDSSGLRQWRSRYWRAGYGWRVWEASLFSANRDVFRTTFDIRRE